MITKEEFLEKMRNGWKHTGFARGQYINWQGECCAMGAYMKGKGTPIRRTDGGTPYFEDEAVEALKEELGGMMNKVIQINDDYSYMFSKSEDAKASIISRIEALPWPST